MYLPDFYPFPQNSRHRSGKWWKILLEWISLMHLLFALVSTYCMSNPPGIPGYSTFLLSQYLMIVVISDPQLPRWCLPYTFQISCERYYLYEIGFLTVAGYLCKARFQRNTTFAGCKWCLADKPNCRKPVLLNLHHTRARIIELTAQTNKYENQKLILTVLPYL